MYRILLVDDEILVRDAIRENIDWASMDCELAGDCENGRQAADFVREHPVDIVLTDILMPYMDGMELSAWLHENYPDIVIVIFSGFGEFEYAKKAIQYGVSEYMLKPVTAMELRQVIGRMKEKVDAKRQEKEKLKSLTKTSQDYRRNVQIIRSKAMEALVGGTRALEDSLKELEGLGVHLDASSYRVAAFDMDLYQDLSQVAQEKRQESALMSFVLLNVADEIVTREDAGVAYQEGSNRVCVLFAGSRSRDFAEKIRNICEEIRQQVFEAIGIRISVGIGGWVREFKDLILSHDQAENAIRCRYLLGGSLFIDTEEKKPGGEVNLTGDIERMTEVVKGGDRESLERILGEMEQKIKEALLEKSQACICLQQIIRAAASCAESMGQDSETTAAKNVELMREITAQNSFAEAFSRASGYVQEVYGQLRQLGRSSASRQAAMAVDYIRQNYMQPDLSLNDICSYLNISTSYFSTIYKEETGETFMETLIRIRMDKAKELLANTTLRNYEIAEKVGFSDPHYFGISFKKATGKTPTEYAREMRR